MIPLTEEQKKAVTHRKGPACVIAGAGTGKTSALTARIDYLIKNLRVDPSKIAITTFTRKATAELYERVHKDVGEKAQKVQITTIDALIYDLAKEAMQDGLMPTRRLVGEANQKLLLLQAAWESFGQGISKNAGALDYGVKLQALQETFGESRSIFCDRRRWASCIKELRLMRVFEDAVYMELANERDKSSFQKKIYEKLSRTYDLRDRKGIDFSFRMPSFEDVKKSVGRYFQLQNEMGVIDYALLTKNLFDCLAKNERFRKKVSSKINWLLVDEFQDTSADQFNLLLLLAGKKKNIWVVGDPCQQIYEWRGAAADNFPRFVKRTKAKTYRLTENWRSTQPILDSAYKFLSKHAKELKKKKLLAPLKSARGEPQNRESFHNKVENSSGKNEVVKVISARQRLENHPVYSAKIESGFRFIKFLLDSNPHLKPSDIAILSRSLNGQIIGQLKKYAERFNLKLQFYSSDVKKTIESTIQFLPRWKAGSVLKSLYRHPLVTKILKDDLKNLNFENMRTIRALASVADAVDSTLNPTSFTFDETLAAIEKVHESEVAVTSAVSEEKSAIQVMTVHAAKGLEFPVVLLMRLSNDGQFSFPSSSDNESYRLVYVGATRARDCLILGHTIKRPERVLNSFGKNIRRAIPGYTVGTSHIIEAPAVKTKVPLIAATHLDIYSQCPLKFGAYHEGRFLPKWTQNQSIGARMHKALEYYLRKNMPSSQEQITECFMNGLKDGDSPVRTIKQKDKDDLKKAYFSLAQKINRESLKPVVVEHRYRYMHEKSGQIEGVVDAIFEKENGDSVLKEWKTNKEIPTDKIKQYGLQVRAGALGICAKGEIALKKAEIVPVFDPRNSINFNVDTKFFDESKGMIDKIFKDITDRSYKPIKGIHCRSCNLKICCPAWTKK
jgi:DNA helicase II / ATP-dependent DNA helicase PcrA